MIIDTRAQKYCEKAQLKYSIPLAEKLSNYYKEQSSITENQQLDLDTIEKCLSSDDQKKFLTRKRLFVFIIASEPWFSNDDHEELLEEAVYDDIDHDLFSIPETKIKKINKKIEDPEHQSSVTLGIETCKLLLEDKVTEVYMLGESADNFFQRYPYLNILAYPKPNAAIIPSLPNDMLNSRLYLGGYQLANQWDVLTKLGISHILNVTEECPNMYEEKGITYLKISIKDEDDSVIAKFFKEAYNFIDSVLENDPKATVLIHCAKGISRSATIVIMYLMRKLSWNLEKALSYVQNRRNIVNPNFGFLNQLKDFEVRKRRLSFEITVN
jgi:protein-tyrosine phosphatase